VGCLDEVEERERMGKGMSDEAVCGSWRWRRVYRTRMLV
jgi:hypothetical protein